VAEPGSQRFAAAVSQHPVAATAIAEVVGEVLDRVGPAPDVALLFVTGPHLRAVGDFVDVVRAALAPRVLAGATAASVVGGAEEIEDVAAVTLWAGRVGAVRGLRLDAFHDDQGWAITGLPSDVADRPRTLVLLADPSSFPTDAFVRQVSATAPQLTVVGGLASAGTRPSDNRLVLDRLLLDDGAVGVLLDDADVDVVVSQGCRPIGDPFIVTRSDGNFLLELGGRPALERLQQLIDGASPDERALLARGVHLGIVIDEHRAEFGRGDFLVRNVLGAQKTTGAVAVGDLVEPGTTVQFQVRDAASADDDLRVLLGAQGAAVAALMFTCNGRGTPLFGVPHHDAALVSASVRGGAVGGMFCAGEIGPVGGRMFLHGFTASVLLFR
jgi:small ligand-binding sensory domain FIST